MRRTLVIATASALFALTVVVVWFLVVERTRQEIALGSKLYASNCAACHGPELGGQPNWQTARPDGKMSAPPLNSTGHAPHHPEAELFRIVKRGMASLNSRPSDMPPFQGVLSDEEISAVLAYIESTW